MFKIIKTEEEYQVAMERLEDIFDSKKGTPEGDELELLSLLIEKYEEKYFPIGFPDPIEYIIYCIENTRISKEDLTKYMGGATRFSQILDRKKPLTLKMIKDLHHHLHIPADLLLAS